MSCVNLFIDLYVRYRNISSGIENRNHCVSFKATFISVDSYHEGISDIQAFFVQLKTVKYILTLEVTFAQKGDIF